MRTRALSILAVLAAVLLPSGALAIGQDAPHDGSGTDGQCSNCHDMTANQNGTNFNQTCLACHQGYAAYAWLDSDQAVPGQKGNHHSWTGQGVNPALGTNLPAATETQRRFDAGKLQCTVCHNPHLAAPQNAPAGRRTSPLTIGTPAAQNSGVVGGTATMTLVTAGAVAKGYRVKIQAGGTSFVISHDYALANRTWFNYVGGAWVAGTEGGPGRPFTPGVTVALDDPAVTVVFNGAAVAGNSWDFRVTYPFLRTSLVDDSICYDCHKSRKMTHVRVSGQDASYPANGTNLFSHPVDQALNANGEGYDRAAAAILDANGVAQATGDAIGLNDLVLSAGLVRCTTCHRVHKASSSSVLTAP